MGGRYVVQGCYRYPDDMEPGGSWKAAAAFAVLTFIFSFVVIIIKCCAAAYPGDPRRVPGGRIAWVLLLLTGISQVTRLNVDIMFTTIFVETVPQPYTTSSDSMIFRLDSLSL